MTESTFTAVGLRDELIDNLASLGYDSMTPIQSQSLPKILAGQDLIAQAKTGSGKTAAFGLGLLNTLDSDSRAIQALILCPTRELADQVADALRKMARLINNTRIVTLCGGVPIKGQLISLENTAHIIVGTPGRIADHLVRQSLDLGQCKTLVLDEADRMLDMGFEPQIDAVLEAIPAANQRLLFSATFPKEIAKLAEKVMHDPVMVKVESQHDEYSIEQHFYQVADEDERLEMVDRLLRHYQPAAAVIFCNTKREVEAVYQSLQSQRYRVNSLHGDLEQRDRDVTLAMFANGSVNVLVATDVAARGLDIDSVDLVINEQIAFEPEVHVHRVGRTGRAGATGTACTLFSQKESFRFDRLKEYLNLHDEAINASAARLSQNDVRFPELCTVEVSGGKKDKVRPGDIVGALTADKTITSDDIGKIQVKPQRTYVAVKLTVIKEAMDLLKHGKIKGRTFKARRIS